MFTNIGYYTYLLLLLILSICSLLSIIQKSSERKILSLLFSFTFLTEVLAYVLGRVYHNNLIVYHFFGPVQFFLITIYFNSIIPQLRQKNLGVYLGIIGIVFGITNSIFIQKVNEFNSNFLLFESIVVIALSLQSFRCIIAREDIDPLKHQPFWISLVFLLFFSITYTYWGLGYAFDQSEKQIFLVMTNLLIVINILTYLSFTIIIILGKKRKLLNEN